MRLQTKLLVAQFPLAVALTFVASLSLSSISTLGRSSRDIVKDNHRSVLAAQRMLNAIERIQAGVVLALLGDPAAPRPGDHRATFEAELAVEERNITEAGEGDWCRRLRASWTAYTGELERLARTRDRRLGTLLAHYDAVQRGAQAILDVNQDAIIRKSMEADATSHRLVQSTSGTSLVALVLGLLATVALTRHLLAPLDSLTRAARRLGEGDLEIRATAVGSDEIAELATEFNEMAERVAESRRGAMGQLLRAQKASQAAIDSIPYPVLVVDISGQPIAVNQVGQSVLALVEPALRSALEAVKTHVFSGKGSYTPKGFEEAIPVSLPEGTRYLLPRATPIYGENGSIAATTMVLQDVTRLRRFDELKNDLVATVAHELRTPLTSLHLAIHVCVEGAAGPVTEKQSELLHSARQDCERLQSIVDDLLNLARLQAGEVADRRQVISPGSLVEQAVGAHEALARESGVELAGEVIEPAESVNVDPESVQSVFSNLITNALKHSPRGATVRVRARSTAEETRFEVVDSGPGIHPEHQPRVFDRFFRVPGQSAEGAGLGLSIAREIVQRQRGSIGVESEPGHGATFWFSFPVAR